jgi:hypothetical protein
MNDDFKQLYLLSREFSLNKVTTYVDKKQFFKRLTVADMLKVHTNFLSYYKNSELSSDNFLILGIIAMSLYTGKNPKQHHSLLSIKDFTQDRFEAEFERFGNNKFLSLVLAEYSVFSKIFNFIILDETAKNPTTPDLLKYFREEGAALEKNLYQIDNDVAMFQLQYPHIDISTMLLGEYSLFYANLKMRGGVGIADQIATSLSRKLGQITYLLEAGNTIAGLKGSKDQNKATSTLKKIKLSDHAPYTPTELIYELNGERLNQRNALTRLREFDTKLHYRKTNPEKYNDVTLPRLNLDAMEMFRKIMFAVNRGDEWELVNKDFLEYLKGVGNVR